MSRIIVVGVASWLPVTLILMGASTAGGQTRGADGTPGSNSVESRAVPRTPDGQPDLQGLWNFSSKAPMERPEEFADKEFLTEAEALELQRRQVEAQIKIERARNEDRGLVDRTGYDTSLWFEDARHQLMTRTALIVDPPNGRIPPLTPAAKQRVEAADVANEIAAGPEDRQLTERCMIGFNAGPPIVPSVYNNNLQILQTADQVVVRTEMIHEARIVPVDGRPHLPSSMPQWAGNSRGRWEGDTLVIETRNFHEKTLPTTAIGPGFAFRRNVTDKGSDQLHVTERLRRVDADMLFYEFTINDPGTYTAPWTARVHMTKMQGRIYEYACHEGNYAMPGILSGTRAVERKAASQSGVNHRPQ